MNYFYIYPREDSGINFDAYLLAEVMEYYNFTLTEVEIGTGSSMVKVGEGDDQDYDHLNHFTRMNKAWRQILQEENASKKHSVEVFMTVNSKRFDDVDTVDILFGLLQILPRIWSV